ncbi:hypothetical protein [Ralstonia solanacearum]|uniref:hypothetical protein n=1 Tax=Ralstonia solanacearum TaxID=305 RepID=UPI00202A8A90|nr:hypothetical protein [Ralstonia solanacearum]MCL9844625.1 hypothetical protein [Ralstonia solanacearum]MDC6253156.1 hypothetical protein [Ralstonia solanacearum]MDC6257738.1 hypothetical protein [Ralstonia solanacearum]MDC6301606.1 hypothetical protein [Ralstonia solanacearum]
MRQIGFDRKFGLLAQEAHLTKNTLLSGFDLLLKANFFQDKDGYFYSAFFHISIGMERVLKLAVVTHFMLTNNYQTPTIKQLKNQFGHDIATLYSECVKLMPTYLNPQATLPALSAEDQALVDFFTEYGVGSRYFNLNEICEAKMDRSPLYKWLDLARTTYEDYTPGQVRERSALNLMYRMDREGPPNGFTSHLDEHGHPMMVFDCLHRQYVVEKSAPLVIWRLIEVLQPIYFLLEAMSHKASEYEAANGISTMVIPHYEDFFPFLLADRATIKRRKKWLDIFNS